LTLKAEIRNRLLPQIRHIPVDSLVILREFHGRLNWIISVSHPQLQAEVDLWFGTDGERDWTWDGLIRIGAVYRENIVVVWQIFQRYSDGTYRRVREVSAPPIGRHFFISYVNEDSDVIDRLQNALEESGAIVWRDRNEILPGQRWQDAIKKAIQEGAYFLACFSSNSESRSRTYMREELYWAVTELRKRSRTNQWLIPIKLSPCIIPSLPIGFDEDLSNIQFVDLSVDWNKGVARLLKAVGR